MISDAQARCGHRDQRTVKSFPVNRRRGCKMDSQMTSFWFMVSLLLLHSDLICKNCCVFSVSSPPGCFSVGYCLYSLLCEAQLLQGVSPQIATLRPDGHILISLKDSSICTRYSNWFFLLLLFFFPLSGNRIPALTYISGYLSVFIQPKE